MPTETDLAALLARVPADGTTIGNGALREALGWNDARYAASREALVAQGTVIRGQGRGGTCWRGASCPTMSMCSSSR